MDGENAASCSSDSNKDNTSDQIEKPPEQFLEGYNTFEDFMKVNF